MHLMIDIETLDTGPRSVVLSMAALRFDTRGPVDDGVHWPLQLTEQCRQGRTVSESTLQFWMRQDPEAQEAAFSLNEPAFAPAGALHQLAEYALAEDRPKIVGVWAKSPSFDLVILDTLMDEVGCERRPWHYRQSRDVRTLEAMVERSRDWQPDPGSLPLLPDHHALLDCHWQAWSVVDCYERLGVSL